MLFSRKPRSIGRRRLLVAASAIVASPAIVRAQGQAGIALVIGNSKYQWEAQLPNVQRDAPDIANRFRQLGLKTDLLQDITGPEMKEALKGFAAASNGARMAVLYFAGHGAQWENRTYIVPVSANLDTPEVVKNFPSVPLIRQITRKAQGRLLVFDSCRNNPADGWRQQWAVDLGQVARSDAVEPNSLTLFSTAPGRVAMDGPPGQNSPFCAALLRQLASPSVDLQSLPARLRRDLLMATDGRQVVWDFDFFRAPFLLNGPPGSAPAATGGIGADRVVELPNTYAYAAKEDLFLPSGLIACRPRNASTNSRMVGTYQVPFAGNTSLLIVMSVEDSQAVEVILSSHHNLKAYWRFAKGKIVGDTLEFTGASWGGHWAFKWKDANSGSVAVQVVDTGSQRNGKIYTASFTRLDG